MDDVDKLLGEVDRLHGLIEGDLEVSDILVTVSHAVELETDIQHTVAEGTIRIAEQLLNEKIPEHKPWKVELVSTTAFDWLDNLRRTHERNNPE